MLLDVHPLELRFRFEPNKLMACSLDLTNSTDEQVAFGLLKKSNGQACFLSRLPMSGIVDPRTTYSLVVIMDKHTNLPHERSVDLILKTSTYYEILRDKDMCMQYFKNAEELGNTVHNVTLKGVCALQGETIFEHSIPPSIEVISMEDSEGNSIFTMDANQTEPLIITGTTGSGSHIHMWNYDTQKSMGSIELPDGDAANSVRFIARKGWFLAGSDDGLVYVYSYKSKMQKTTSFKAHRRDVHSVSIHPTQSYVLSASRYEIKLWDWDQCSWFGWKCMQTFEENYDGARAVAFNPKDYNSFASASNDNTIKVWSLDSPKSKYTLSGHLEAVHCLDFFTRGDDQLYLITGSDDKTAKIWDMQKKECVRTLPHRFGVRSVLPHPKLSVLVTGTADGHVHLWSSINFRLKKTLNICSVSPVRGLACLIESGRVVVAHWEGVTVVEIRDEEEWQGSINGNN